MDAAGKLCDILIFIIVLFIVPSLWAVSAAQKLKTEDAVRCADDFISYTVQAEGISDALLNKLNESIKGNAGLFFTIYIQRDAVYDEPSDDGGREVYSGRELLTMDEISEEIETKGEFRLLPGDTVTLEIFDRDSVLYTAVRRKRTY